MEAIKNIQRKCRNCGTWNKDEEHCTNCGELLNPLKIMERERAEKEKQRILLRKPSALDRWFERVKHSKNPFVRVFYRLAYTVWMLLVAIVGFILYAVAATPG